MKASFEAFFIFFLRNPKVLSFYRFSSARKEPL